MYTWSNLISFSGLCHHLCLIVLGVVLSTPCNAEGGLPANGVNINPYLMQPGTHFHVIIDTEGNMYWRPGNHKRPGVNIDNEGIKPRFADGTVVPDDFAGKPNGGHLQLDTATGNMRPTRAVHNGGFIINEDGSVSFKYNSNSNLPEHTQRELSDEAKEQLHRAVNEMLERARSAVSPAAAAKTADTIHCRKLGRLGKLTGPIGGVVFTIIDQESRRGNIEVPVPEEFTSTMNALGSYIDSEMNRPVNKYSPLGITYFTASVADNFAQRYIDRAYSGARYYAVERPFNPGLVPELWYIRDSSTISEEERRSYGAMYYGDPGAVINLRREMSRKPQIQLRDF